LAFAWTRRPFHRLEIWSTVTDWLFSLIQKDKCLSHNKGGGGERLWPHLLRFVSAATRLVPAPKPGADSGRSLDHVLRILCKAFEQDDQAQVSFVAAFFQTSFLQVNVIGYPFHSVLPWLDRK